MGFNSFKNTFSTVLHDIGVCFFIVQFDCIFARSKHNPRYTLLMVLCSHKSEVLNILKVCTSMVRTCRSPIKPKTKLHVY